MTKATVMKFGGKSLASIKLFKAVAQYIVARFRKSPDTKIIVVVSAGGDRTNEILANLKKLNPNPPPREKAAALRVGEEESAPYLAVALCGLGLRASSYNAIQLGIQTIGGHDDAKIQAVDHEKLDRAIRQNDVIVVAGFQGINENDTNEIVILGRGGSDLTAVALAAELKCKVEFYKSGVAGIHAFDPRVSSRAKVFKRLSFSTAISLVEYGYEFLMMRSLRVAERFGVPIEFRQTPGLPNHDPWKIATVIDSGKTEDIEESGGPLCAIAVKEHQTLIVFGDVPNIPGWSDRIYSVVDIKFIDSWQVSFGNKAAVAILINKEDEDSLLPSLSCFQSDEVTLMVTRNLINITLVHSQANSESRIFYRIGKCLHATEVNIQAQYSSGIFIHTLVDTRDKDKAVLALAREFNLEEVENGI